MENKLFNALEILNKTDHYPRWLVAKIAPYLKGRVLDIGSGWGDLAKLYDVPGVEEITFTDVASCMLDVLHTRFSADNVKFKVRAMDILSFADVKAGGLGRYDIVTSVNVFEHIEDDLRAMQNARALLCPGGKMIAIVPAMPWIYGTIDKLAGHHRRYGAATLRQRLLAAGFRVEKIAYMNMFGTFSWFLAGKVFRCRKFPENRTIWLDRVVPVLRAVEKVIPPFFGQSLVAVAVNPDGEVLNKDSKGDPA